MKSINTQEYLEVTIVVEEASNSNVIIFSIQSYERETQVKKCR